MHKASCKVSDIQVDCLPNMVARYCNRTALQLGLAEGPHSSRAAVQVQYSRFHYLHRGGQFRLHLLSSFCDTELFFVCVWAIFTDVCDFNVHLK
jgi:hypothetical protein